MEVKILEKKDEFVCPECGKKFPTKRSLQAHMACMAKMAKKHKGVSMEKVLEEEEEEEKKVTAREMDDDGIYSIEIPLMGRQIKELESVGRRNGFLDIGEIIREAIREYLLQYRG